MIRIAIIAIAIFAAVPVLAQVPATPPDVAAVPDDVERAPSGLASRMLTPGSGDRHVTETDLVVVHYTLWTTDGRLIDSTHQRETTARFSLNGVIPGWRECVTQMMVGESRRCWVPQELAYKGQKDRPRGMLVFDVEVVSAEPSPTVPPPDVAMPPSDALQTESGLHYKELQPGIGARKPYEDGAVTVHYTGWTTAGKMFDSSIARGQPTSFGLGDVIKGWSEGVQLMVEGQKMRFWIPEALAYAEGGGPQGMLVFDIELLSIDR